MQIIFETASSDVPAGKSDRYRVKSLDKNVSKERKKEKEKKDYSRVGNVPSVLRLTMTLGDTGCRHMHPFPRV